MKPWKQLAKKTVHLNAYRQMHKVRYRLPNGKAADFYLLERGRVICAFVITRDRHVIIAKQFRPGPNRVLWELVGGRIDPGETPRQAAIRETLEETGYRGRVVYLGQSSNDAWSTLTRYHFIIRDARKVKDLRLDDHEFIEAKSITLTKLRQLMRHGDLTDTETAYRALDFLGWLRPLRTRKRR